MTIYKFAGFWRRFIAYTIDGLIIAVIIFILTFISVLAYISGAMSGAGRAIIGKISDPEQILLLTMWVWIFSILLNLAYFTLFHGSTGRTPGKKLLGLQVVTVEGGPLTYGIAFLRSVGYVISSLVLCLGYLWVVFDKKKQGWHDKIAGTVVIIREPDGHSAGISISDSPATSPDQPVGGITKALSQAEKQKDEAAPTEEAAGPNDQKIP